jgi:hypothetical protein
MERNPHNQVERLIGKKHACYILITCDHPSPDGEMQVEMTYRGDAVLASYLIDGARHHLDQEEFSDLQIS